MIRTINASIKYDTDTEHPDTNGKADKMNKLFTRKQYMNGEISHNDYFAQFCDYQTKADLLAVISLEEIKASTDEHMNDIPLEKWDSISGVSFRGSTMLTRPRVNSTLADKLDETGEGVSPAGLVCVYKAQARILKGDK